MDKFFRAFLFGLLLLTYGYVQAAPPNIEQLNHFNFGSCNKQFAEQPHWQEILQRQPQFFMWVGDAYYADTEDRDTLEEKMLTQYNHPDYIPLRESVPVIGVWDDHDFGDNDTDRTYPLREFAQQNYLDL